MAFDRQVVVLRPDRDGSIPGDAVDLSAAGMAVRVSSRLRPGERVVVRLESAAPTGAILDLPGTVTWAERDGTRGGQPMTRAGLSFEDPERAAEQARALAPHDAAVRADPTDVTTAQSPVGRELLYQRAVGRLAAGDHAGARLAALASLRVIPHARHMRALLCRIDASAAVAAGRCDEALRRVDHGRRLCPDDPIWDQLAEAAGPTRPARRGLWARLLSRSASR